MKRFIPIVILICSLSASAQTYLPFHKERLAYYQFGYNAYATFYTQAAIAIDSFKVEGSDTIFYHSSIMDYNPDYGCIKPFDTSFVGIKSIRTADGRDLFFNRAGDTIVINNNASLHESWEMIRGLITATVDSIVEENVFGISDSVKVIDLNGYGTLRIGKSSGLISGVSLFHLPFYTLPFEIAGIENPSHGLSISFNKLFNFNVGDRFDYIHASAMEPTTHSTEYETKVILSKSVFSGGDSLVYKIQHRYNWQTNNYNDYSFSIGEDTITEIYSRRQYTFLNSKPNQWSNAAYGYYYFAPSTRATGSIYLIFKTEEFTNWKDSCLTRLINDGPTVYAYETGLGETSSFSGITGSGESYSYDSLLYFNKSGVEWGDSIDWVALVGVTTVTKSSNFSIFPNPANNLIHIKGNTASQTIDVTLLNYLGEEVKSYQFAAANNNTIDISGLPQGLYFIQIKTGSETTNLKFVKAE